MTLPRAPVPAAGCEGKQAFAADEARRVASNMRQRGRVVDTYKCTACGRWHIGSHVGGNMDTRRALQRRNGREA